MYFANSNTAYIGSNLLGLKQIVSGSPGLGTQLLTKTHLTKGTTVSSSRYVLHVLYVFLSYITKYKTTPYATVLCSVLSDSLPSHGLYPARLLCPWDFPGKILERVAISYCRGSS